MVDDKPPGNTEETAPPSTEFTPLIIDEPGISTVPYQRKVR